MLGRFRSRAGRLAFLLALLVVASATIGNTPAEARRKSHAHASRGHAASRSHSRGSRGSARGSRRGRGGRHIASGGGRRGRRGRHHHHHHIVHHPRYAYPVEMFMINAPDFDASPLPPDQASEVANAFVHGIAEKYPARTLVKAGVVKYHPLHGGIYWRREPVKYIIMHSTETGVPVGALNVINGWSSLGRRHPGAQYVVDRDGTIYQSVDPDLATVHINILKTLPGINNDNSIGIEINHTGSQSYPEVQIQSVIRLVTYLQDRYQIDNENIVTHRYAQRGDHTDPVRFDWTGFLSAKDRYRNQAIAYKMNNMEKQSQTWGEYTDEEPSTYLLQPHTMAPLPTGRPLATGGTAGTGLNSSPSTPGIGNVPPLANGSTLPMGRSTMTPFPGQPAVTPFPVQPAATPPLGQPATDPLTGRPVAPQIGEPGVAPPVGRTPLPGQSQPPARQTPPPIVQRTPQGSPGRPTIAAPSSSVPEGSLRGPIEVGPDYVDDLKNVMPQP